MSKIIERLFSKRLIIALGCVGIMLGQIGYAKTLTVGAWLSPNHPMNNYALKTWGKWVKDATDGRVVVKLKFDQIHPKNIFGEVEDGNYDAGWSYHGYLPGKFKLTVMAELPLLGADAEAASKAYWKVYNKYFAKAGEHRGLYLAALFLHGPGQILLRKPIKSLSELKNKKIRVGGGVQGFIAKELGVNAVAAPGSKVYEMLSQGVVDGVFMPIGEQSSSRLAEVTKFIYEAPQGMYLGSFAFFISPDFLNSISKKDAAAIKKLSGAKLSALMGSAWKRNDVAGRKKALAAGVVIKKWSKSDINRFKKIAKRVEKNWLKDVKNINVDAKKALKEYRKLARSY